MGEHHEDLPVAARVRRLEERAIAAGLATDEELDAVLTRLYASASPVNGARMVARAWTDPGYRERLLAESGGQRAWAAQHGRLHAVLLLPGVPARTLAGLVQEPRLPITGGP